MNDPKTNQADHGRVDLEALLSQQASETRLRRWRWPAAAVAGMLLVGWLMVGNDRVDGEPRYVTERVTRGTLVVDVTATGNLEPTNLVDVGSELSGTVIEVYVEEDDRVTEGQVLAQLDPAKFEDAVERSRAALAVATADLQQAQATRDEAEARLSRYREAARLSDNKVPSQAEMETAEAELARAVASVASARAGLQQATAALRSDETDLAKTEIKSPIDGVVLARQVNSGQAVAASLQAVTLFTLAEDLSKMELKVDVDEADVGQVKAGQQATFTVDAWPDRTFEAEIIRVGFNATDNDGVISYPAILVVDNEDLSLRPGMTAMAEVVTVTRDDALLVPNAALRFAPQTATAEPEGRGGGLVGSLIPGPPRGAQKTKTDTMERAGRVWLLRQGEPVSVAVTTGATSDRFTEITGGSLDVGDDVITEMAGSGQ